DVHGAALPDEIEIEEARRALGYLPESWRDDYDQWLRVGMALSELREAGLAIWKEWSRPSSKYSVGMCDAKWATITPGGGLKIGSLYHWAKEHGFDPNPKLVIGKKGSSSSDDGGGDTAVSATGQAPMFALTDMGNAERFAAQHRGTVRYCHAWRK